MLPLRRLVISSTFRVALGCVAGFFWKTYYFTVYPDDDLYFAGEAAGPLLVLSVAVPYAIGGALLSLWLWSRRTNVDDQFRRRMFSELESLPDNMRRVLHLRFGIGSGVPKDLDEVASELGLRRERVRQIEAKALRKMRRAYAD